MLFSTTLKSKGGKSGAGAGRLFSFLLGGILTLAAATLFLQVWAGYLWGGPEAPERPEIRPASTAEPIGYDDLQDPVPAQVVREPRVARDPPPAPPPVRRVTDQRRAERLTDVAWDVADPPEAPAWYLDGRRELLGEGCALRPGVSIIPATLVTAIDSEIPGQVIANVTETVYSPDLGYKKKPLVRQGTRVVGRVDKGGGLTLDRGRVDIVWSEMTNPFGFGDPSVTQVDLGQAHDASADGSAGTGGEVRQRYGQLLAYAALSTVFNVAQRGTLGNNNTFLNGVQDETSRTVGDVGERVIDRSLSWEPKIVVDAGTQVRVLIRQTVRVC